MWDEEPREVALDDDAVMMEAWQSIGRRNTTKLEPQEKLIIFARALARGGGYGRMKENVQTVVDMYNLWNMDYVAEFDPSISRGLRDRPPGLYFEISG